MRVIVTGGAGFIGSALCRFLIEENKADVLIIDKLTYAGNLASLSSVAASPRYRLTKADICNLEAMRSIIGDFEPDAIVHLAAESHVDRSITGSRPFIETNIVGTFTLLEACRLHWNGLPHRRRLDFRFLHVSTDEVYGSLGAGGSFSETTPYDPSSPYSSSKAAADHLVRAWHRTYGIPTIVSNCSNNFGPYQYPEKLVPLMILSAHERKRLPVYGDGRNIRDWLYVEDHVRALYLILTRGRVGENYNVGAGNERTNLEVVRLICQVFDRIHPQRAPHEDLIKFVVDRPGHDYRYAIDGNKLKIELGWQANESFESGIEKTVHWYVHNAEWWSPLRESFDRDGVPLHAAETPSAALPKTMQGSPTA